jgi:FtsP/CotA-like multicopper oxidase with cupredoxin domain
MKLPRRQFLHLAAGAGLMSALGQKQTWRDQIAMSALPPKADIRPCDQDVCFGPILLQKSVASFFGQ